MEVSLGVLIVGSLYWDDQLHRSQWRHERLDLEAPTAVLAPIRYGRRSQTRGNSYTMVFSETLAREEVKLGTAIFVLCKRLVRTVEDLVEEAEILWAAERNSGASNGRISADWGCVGLAVNPAHPIPDDLRRGWGTRVSREQCCGGLDHTEDEKAIVERSGVLNIPWPKCTDGSHLEVNALLATATNPTLVDGRYPSAQEIADAWNTDTGSNYVQYFWKNREHDITTFQDDKIESYLNDGRPVSPTVRHQIMSTPENEWEEFINTVAANVRQHAGYFSWESDRSIEEVGVVQSLHESLEKLREGFFHSYRSRGDGNDPPDCEALDTEGDRIGIEVTELVDGSSISATRRGGLTPWEPWKKVELYELIRQRIEIKDNPYELKGGPYREYILIIYCDEPRVLHYDLIEYIRGCVFGPTKRLDRVFLLMSYSPWEQCCPFVELQLNI